MAKLSTKFLGDKEGERRAFREERRENAGFCEWGMNFEKDCGGTQYSIRPYVNEGRAYR
jgi:hypothetical protein